MDRKFVTTAFIYAIVGLSLGIYMSVTKNHAQFVTHAHIMLIGFLLSFAYAICHKLWLNSTGDKLLILQFYAHQVGTFAVLLGLFLLFGQFAAEATLGPLLGLGSILVLVATLLMFVALRRN